MYFLSGVRIPHTFNMCPAEWKKNKKSPKRGNHLLSDQNREKRGFSSTQQKATAPPKPKAQAKARAVDDLPCLIADTAKAKPQPD
jgi:hypothetical protein